jgi:hypothetical protein
MTEKTLNQSDSLNAKKEACKTFIEQTKLLVTLASGFIIAPAIAKTMIELKLNAYLLIAEIGFMISVLSGYISLGSVTGSQFRGDFNVYRKATMLTGKIQFFSYLFGLILFLGWIFLQP